MTEYNIRKFPNKLKKSCGLKDMKNDPFYNFRLNEKGNLVLKNGKWTYIVMPYKVSKDGTWIDLCLIRIKYFCKFNRNKFVSFTKFNGEIDITIGKNNKVKKYLIGY